MRVVRASWLLSLLLAACLVTGVKAEMTETALIATACVVGVLLLAAVLGAVIYCSLRHRNQHTKKKRLPAAKSTAYPQPPNSNNGDITIISNSLHRHHHGILPPLHGGPAPPRGVRGAKAHTQHLVPSRHRPPLTFYTIRRDPRDVGIVPPPPGGVAVAPGGARVWPATLGGRPVVYLDMLGTVRPQPPMAGTGGGTSTGRNENGSARGLLIRELDNGDASQEERYRKKDQHHHSKKSRGRSKSRSRSDSPTTMGGKKDNRSRSRSRDAMERDSRPRSRYSTHSVDDPPIFALPGDIILSESHRETPHTDAFTDTRKNDFTTGSGGFTATSLHPTGGYSITAGKERQEPEYETVERPETLPPFSLADNTFDTPTADYTNSNPTLHDSEPSPRDAISVFARSQTGQEPVPTPRADYLPGPSLAPEPLTLRRRDSDNEHQPTPRADYSANRDSAADMPTFSFPAAKQPYSPPLEKSMETGGANQSFETILNSVNFNEEVSRNHRPPTPPFDGETSPRDSVYPPRRSLRQMSHPDGRMPSPPPDIPQPNADGDSDTGETLATSQVVATIPRAPTPPPGRILKPTEPEMAVLGDLQEEEAKSSKHPQSPTAHLPALPFMAELRRRQGSHEEEEDDPRGDQQHQPFSLESMQQRGDDILRGLDAVLFPEGINASRSHVSFTSEPPQIIPSKQTGSSTSLPPDYDDPSPGPGPSMAPPPPPPPPTPPPPPSPPTPPLPAASFSRRF